MLRINGLCLGNVNTDGRVDDMLVGCANGSSTDHAVQPWMRMRAEMAAAKPSGLDGVIRSGLRDMGAGGNELTILATWQAQCGPLCGSMLGGGARQRAVP